MQSIDWHVVPIRQLVRLGLLSIGIHMVHWILYVAPIRHLVKSALLLGSHTYGAELDPVLHERNKHRGLTQEQITRRFCADTTNDASSQSSVLEMNTLLKPTSWFYGNAFRGGPALSLAIVLRYPHGFWGEWRWNTVSTTRRSRNPHKPYPFGSQPKLWVIWRVGFWKGACMNLWQQDQVPVNPAT